MRRLLLSGHATLESMQLAPGVEIDEEALASFCRAQGIRQLSLFGSAMGSRFKPESDVDLLVELEPGQVPRSYPPGSIGAGTRGSSGSHRGGSYLVGFKPVLP